MSKQLQKQDLLGLDITEARKKLGEWYILENQSVVGTGNTYIFHRAPNKKVHIITDEKNIVIFASGNGLVAYDPSFDINHTPEVLHHQAMALYKAHNRDFSQFNNGELYELYKLSAITEENPNGVAYDDEVLDEITKRDAIDGKELIDIFEDKWFDENYLEPAMEMAIKCKEAYENGNKSEADEHWCNMYDFLIPEDIDNVSEDFRNRMFSILKKVVDTFSDEQVYDITDYGKAIEYAKIENDER